MTSHFWEAPSVRRLLLLIWDAAAALAAYHAAFFIRSMSGLSIFSSPMPLGRYWQVTHFLEVLTVAHLGLLALFGLYDEPGRLSSERFWRAVVFQSAGLSVLLAAFYFFRAEYLFPRSIFAVFALLLPWLTALPRLIARRSWSGPSRKRVLVAGGGEEARFLIDELRRDRSGRWELVGVIWEDAGDMPAPGGVPNLGTAEDLARIVREHAVGEILLAPDFRWQHRLVRELVSGGHSAATVRVLPGTFELLLGRVTAAGVNDIPLVDLRLDPLDPLQAMLKRGMDVLIAALALLLTLPVMLGVAVTMKLTMPGPILYRQRRVGLRGEAFDILKLRTMIPDAEAHSGPVLADKRDHRVTPLGRWLRGTRVDEIPQLWNVLRGEMSLVGPRPERPEFVDRYTAEIPGYSERNQVRPGLTGLAQIHGHYATPAAVKLKYDLSYLANHSLWLDIRILFLTAKMLLRGGGEFGES